MASFDMVNFSLRPSKAIQRQIVFDGVRDLQTSIGLDRMVYVGLGSIWFTDFILAHKLLGIDDMVSIEKSEIGHCRAEFNAPFATVRVLHGSSSTVLPALFSDELIRERPWMVWLDFDGEFDEDSRDDVRTVIEGVPTNSFFLVTFNGEERRYGKPADRPDRLRELFGDVVSEDLATGDCKGDKMPETMADLTRDFMQSIAMDMARLGGFVPAFRAIYRDTTTMVTVGGFLPSEESRDSAEHVVSQESWRCRPTKRIVAPHLTLRETLTLQSSLPRDESLSRLFVRQLGFDLEEEQIEAFERYYKEYPAFAQIVA